MKRERARKLAQCSGPGCKNMVNGLKYQVKQGPVFCHNRCKMAEREARKQGELVRCAKCNKPFRPQTLVDGKCKRCRT